MIGPELMGTCRWLTHSWTGEAPARTCKRCNIGERDGDKDMCPVLPDGVEFAPSPTARATYDASTDPVPALSTVCRKCSRPPAEHTSGPNGFVCPVPRLHLTPEPGKTPRCVHVPPGFAGYCPSCVAPVPQPTIADEHWKAWVGTVGIAPLHCCGSITGIHALECPTAKGMQQMHARIAGTPSTMLGEALGHVQRARDLLRTAVDRSGYGHHALNALGRAVGEVEYERQQAAIREGACHHGRFLCSECHGSKAP